MVENIYIAKPRGFCAGVDRAVKIVEKTLEKFSKPIFVRHHIVHNLHIVKHFENKGVKFIEETSEVPENSVLILSAHGTDKKTLEELSKKNIQIIDAVCPLVKKVHFEAIMNQNKGIKVIYIGHKNHQEAIGSASYADTVIIESIENIEDLKFSKEEKLAYLTQTTLSVDETKKIIKKLKEKYPNIIEPPKEDICYATTNRQAAVKDLTKKCEVILILGSKHSSNSNRLKELAQNQGITAYLIEDFTQVQNKWIDNVKNIGISSGASVPENLVEELIEYLKVQYNNPEIKELDTIKENMIFALPKELN